MIAGHPGVGFRVRTMSPRESEVCIVLGCSEKRSDPLVYLFFSFPSLEHIFLCWRLIYNSGNLLQREQVFLWDETPWEAASTSGKKKHVTAQPGREKLGLRQGQKEEEASWHKVTRQRKRASFPSHPHLSLSLSKSGLTLPSLNPTVCDSIIRLPFFESPQLLLQDAPFKMLTSS